MEWQVLVGAAVMGALAIVLAVLADRRSRERRRLASLPPARQIPQLPEDAVPTYVSGEEANTPPDSGARLDPAERERLQAAATARTPWTSGWADPRFVTDSTLGWAVLHDALVVVVEGVGSVRELLPLLERSTAAGKALVVVTGSIDPDTLDTLAVNVVQRHRRALIVRHPSAELPAAARELGTNVLSRTSLQAGWCPPSHVIAVADWVSARDRSWYVR